MPSERVQRRIDRLLDQAEEAVDQRDWSAVHEIADAVLVADPENEDAKTFNAMAEKSLGSQPSSTTPDLQSGTEPPASDTPTSFANGRYEVKGLLGTGSMKRVYLVRDNLLDRDVAFALIKTRDFDDTDRQRITREAQAMGRLGTHPNIVTVFDLGTEGDEPYMVTELMGGGDVQGLLTMPDNSLPPGHKASPTEELETDALASSGESMDAGSRQAVSLGLPLDRVMEIGKAVCAGLEFAHAHGVIHRDLKPSNVWLTEDSTAKIGDFGLAIITDESRLTRSGMIVGTILYMSPEQATGGEITARTDLYSLGAMLYEMVTGRPPFLGDDDIGVIGQHINTPPVAPSWHNQSIPRTLDSLIMRLLAKDPRERPESAAEVLQALEAIDPAEAAAAHENEQGSLDSMSGGVFVGRHREMDQLKATFEDTLGGHGKMVALVGEPGIGKTRTAQELATYAAMRGGQVLWGRCYEGGGAPPYWPWVQAIRSYVMDRDAETVRREMGSTASVIAEIVPDVKERLPDLHPPSQIDDPDSARFRLFDSITTFLKTASGAQPIVLMLEDLHWSDKPSLQLLEFVARELGNARLMIVGNYRDMELNRRHPLSITLGELTRERLFDRVLLRGLQKHDVQRFIEVAAGIDPPSALVDAVYTQTEGNPLFVTETVRLLIQEGDITSGAKTRGGTSSWEIRIPEGVREVIGRRLDRLSERCNEVLTTAAVVGRQFRFGVLMKLVDDVSENMLLDVLDEALDARIVEEVASEVGLYQFAHALMQETLTSELSATRTVRLHARIAEALEEFYGDAAEEHAGELVEHFAEAETVLGAERQVPHLIAAGKMSLGNYDYVDAATYFERALRIRGPELRDRQHADLLADLSVAQSFTLTRHEQQTTIDTRVRSFEIYMALGEIERAVAIAAAYFPSLHGPTGLVHMLEEALKHVSQGTREEALLQALYCQRISIETGQYEPAVAARDRAIEIARELDDPNLELAARVRMLSVHSWHNQMEAREQEILGGARLLDRVDLPPAEVEMHNYAGELFQRRGDEEAARRHVSAAIRIAERLRSTDLMIMAAMAESESLRTGSWEAARSALSRAMEFDPVDPRLLERSIAVECLAGDLKAARDFIDRAVSHVESLDPERSPHQVAAAGVDKLIMIYNDFSEDGYLLDLAMRYARFGAELENIEPLVPLWARGHMLSIKSFGDAPEDSARDFKELAPAFPPAVSGLMALRLGLAEDAIFYLEKSLAEDRSDSHRPNIAFFASRLAEAYISRGERDDREKATELQDEAIAIAQELGMNPVLERVLAQREILKA
ncbi:MAG: protein kinase [Chloroflexi bacterium]|nr:protein kinase [Chloroflexota bacterium]